MTDFFKRLLNQPEPPAAPDAPPAEMAAYLRSLDDRQWGRYAFSREPLEGKFTPQQKDAYTAAANACGAEWADKLGCAWVATGHYSRLEERNGDIYIVAGDDDKKDQSYFLWQLGQDVLRRCIFPLGDYTKVKVREYLADKGYEAKSKEGESMEVCFIKGDYRDFLREQCPELDNEIGPGWFVNSEGVKLGQHKGAPYYTIGQRKGLEIALGKPAYVLKINPQKNTVMLGDAEQLRTDYMLTEQDKIVDERELFQCENLTVRIRYRSRPLPCRVKRLADGRLLVRFLETASAIAPGQSAVFYDGRRVLGGAFIASQRGIGLVILENEGF